MTLKDSQIRPNRLYAHWLDGEWQKIAYPVAVEGRAPYHTLQGVAEGALKLHALFGTRIAISDVQLTDGVVMVKLFANREFRDFLRNDPGFLTLVAQPRQGCSNMRLAIATRGIERAFHPEWTTSLPGVGVDVIRRFGDSLLSLDKLDTAYIVRDRSKGPGHVIASFPEQEELLEGILYGICHFLKTTGGPTDAPVSLPRAYPEFIEDTLNCPALPHADAAALKSVWESIKRWVPDESKRRGRSALLSAMEAEEPNRNKWPHEWHTIWNTAVHAWNANVCDTVGARRASIAPLPGAVVPYRGEISDVAGPFVSEGGLLRARTIRKYPVLSLNPSTLSWLSVRNAVCQVRKERTGFQRALLKQDKQEIEDASADLINGLLRVLAPHPKADPPHWVWLLMSIAGLAFSLPLAKGIAVAGEAQSFLRIQAKKGLVLNTLRGFKDDLISVFSYPPRNL
jgi:hypothetical protein